MNIVFVDAFTANPGDIDWTILKNLGNFQHFERTNRAELHHRCKDAAVVITNKVVFDENIINSLPNLKLICVAATGYNNVDLKAAVKANIVVCNVSGYSTMSVAQHVFSLLLSITNKVSHYNKQVSLNKWSVQPDFSFFEHSIHELRGKTLGILGYGAIGKKVAQIANAFEMNVMANKRSSFNNDPLATYMSAEEILKIADVVSIHTPLTEETKQMVNEDFLGKMKSNAILINTSRGGVIDEEALAKALKNNQIQAAALDVLIEEPPKKDHPLFDLENCLITPHQAWGSLQARMVLIKEIEKNILAFVQGKPRNVVTKA